MASKRSRVTVPQFPDTVKEKEEPVADLNRMGCGRLS
jgi:hypothetical protein